MIDREDLQAVCRQFQLDVSEPVLDDLMDYCDTDKDGLINFVEFANFLNWKDKMLINSREQRIMINGQLKASVSVFTLNSFTLTFLCTGFLSFLISVYQHNANLKIKRFFK